VAAPALVTVFSALADETRLDIVTRLAAGDATLSQLAEHYDMSIQAVSKHLSVLEDAGVVSRRREAQRRPVQLETKVFDLMGKWIERYRHNAEARYQRLDQLLANLDDQTPDNGQGTTT
jgi:DNA-binding transcriptional ArsR family regulator